MAAINHPRQGCQFSWNHIQYEVCFCIDGIVIVWNHEVGATPSPLLRIDVKQSISTGVLSRSKDVAFLGTVEGDAMAVDLNRGVELWHFQTEKLEFEKSFGEGLAMVTAIDCQDGLVGFGTLNGQLFFIDAHTGLELVSFTASQLQRSPFRFHDLVQKDETLGEYAREWCPPLSRIGSIQFLPDLNEVIVGGWEMPVHKIQTSDWSIVNSYYVGEWGADDVMYPETSELAVIGTDGYLRIDYR